MINSWIWIFLLGGCPSNEVISFDGEEFSDQTDQLYNRSFKVEYIGEGQGMTQGSRLIGPGFDRVTAGTKVAWISAGGRIFGKQSGDELCFQYGEASTYPRYFLEAYPNSRIVWRPSFYGLAQTHMFKVFCDGNIFSYASKCQIISRRF